MIGTSHASESVWTSPPPLLLISILPQRGCIHKVKLLIVLNARCQCPRLRFAMSARLIEGQSDWNELGVKLITVIRRCVWLPRLHKRRNLGDVNPGLTRIVRVGLLTTANSSSRSPGDKSRAIQVEGVMRRQRHTSPKPIGDSTWRSLSPIWK